MKFTDFSLHHHQQPRPQLWPALRDAARRLPLLRPRHGQGAAHVPAKVSVFSLLLISLSNSNQSLIKISDLTGG